MRPKPGPRGIAAGVLAAAIVSSCGGLAPADWTPIPSAGTSGGSVRASPRPSVAPGTSGLPVTIGGGWRTVASLPVRRAEVGATVLGNRIYVAGGLDGGGRSLATFEAYDPTTDSWAELAPMPEPRDHVGVAALDGAIYVSGGSIFAAPAVRANLWRYDAAADRWTELQPMPQARWAHAMVALGGRLWVIGGKIKDTAQTTAIVAFDPGRAAGSPISHPSRRCASM